MEAYKMNYICYSNHKCFWLFFCFFWLCNLNLHWHERISCLQQRCLAVPIISFVLFFPCWIESHEWTWQRITHSALLRLCKHFIEYGRVNHSKDDKQIDHSFFKFLHIQYQLLSFQYSWLNNAHPIRIWLNNAHPIRIWLRSLHISIIRNFK